MTFPTDNDYSDPSFLKTLGMSGLLAASGFRFAGILQKSIDNMTRQMSRNTQMRNMVTDMSTHIESYSGIGAFTTRQAYSDSDGSSFTSSYEYASTESRDLFSTEPTPDTEVHVSHEETVRRILTPESDKVIREVQYMIDNPLIAIENGEALASQVIKEHSGSDKATKNLYTEYGELKAMLTDHDMTIDPQSIKETPHSFVVTIEAASKSDPCKPVTLELPKDTFGTVVSNGKRQIGITGATLHKDNGKLQALRPSPKRARNEALRKNVRFSNMRDKRGNRARVFADALNQAVDDVYHKMEGNDLEMLTKDVSYIADVQKEVNIPFNHNLIENRGKLQAMMVGAPLIEIDEFGVPHNTGGKINPSGWGEGSPYYATSSMTMHPMTRNMNQVDYRRGNALRGHRGQMTTKDILATFGIVNKKHMERALHSRETYTGGMSTMLFVDSSLSAEGSAEFILRQNMMGGYNADRWRGVTLDTLTMNFDKDQVDAIHKGIQQSGDQFDISTLKLRGIDGRVINKPAYLHNIEQDGKYVKIRVAYDRPIQSGDKADKFAIRSLKSSREISDLFAAEQDQFAAARKVGGIMKSMEDNGMKGVGPDFINEMDMLKKYHGGMTGLGMVHRTLNDVLTFEINKHVKKHGKGIWTDTAEKLLSRRFDGKLKGIVESMFGQETAEAFDSIEIVYDKTTKEPKVSMVLKDAAGDPSVTGDGFESSRLATLAGFDTEFERFHAKQGGKFVDMIKGMQNSLQTYLKQNNLFGDGMYKIYDDVSDKKISTTNAKNIPSFLIDFSNDAPSLKGVAFNAFTSNHMVGAGRFEKAAEFSGFNGIKFNMDSMRLATMNQDRGLYQFIASQTGKNIDYIIDMVQTQNRRALTDAEVGDIKSGRPVTLDIGGISRPASILSLEDFYKGDETLAGMLMEDFNNRSLAGKLMQSELRVQSDQGTGWAHDTMQRFGYEDNTGRKMTLGDLNTRIGRYGGNAVSVVRRDTMETMRKIINGVGRDNKTLSWVNMELPFRINGTTHLPINRISMASLFEMDANEWIDQEFDAPKGSKPENIHTRTKARYITGSPEVTALVDTVSKIVDVNERWKVEEQQGMRKHPGMPISPSAELVKELEDTIGTYYSRMHAAARGKTSPVSKAATSFYAPLSFSGRGGFDPSLKFGEVGLEPDDMVRFITGNTVHDYNATKDAGNKLKEMKDLRKKITDYSKLQDTLPKDATVLTDTGSKKALDDIIAVARKNNIPSVSEAVADETRRIYASSGGSLSNPKLLGLIDDQIESLSIHKYANDVIRDMKKNPDVELHSYMIRHPEISPGSTTDIILRLSDSADRISDDMLKYYQKGGVNSPIGSNRVRMTKETAALINGDFDGDIYNMFVRSLDYLDKMSLQAGMTQSISQMAGIDSKTAQALSDGALKEYAKSHLVSSLTFGDVQDAPFRPANMSSFTMMYELEKHNSIENMKTRNLMEYMEDQVQKKYKGIGKKATPKQIKDESVKLYKEVLEESGYTSETMMKYKFRVVDDVPTSPTIDAADVSKMAPELFSDTLPDGMSPEAYKEYIRMTTDEKTGYLNFKDDIERKYAVRGREMKHLTPTAFNLAVEVEDMIHMRGAGGKILNAQDMTDVIAFADKTIAQLTISTKKGSPSILDDLMTTFDQFSDIDTPISNTEVNRLFKGNYRLKLHKSDIKEMELLGIAHQADNITYDKYREFLEMKKKTIGDIVGVHDKAWGEAVTLFGDSEYVAKYGADSIRARTQNTVNQGISRMIKDSGTPGFIEEFTGRYSGKGAALAAYMSVSDELKTANKNNMDSFLKGMGDTRRKGLMKNIATGLRELRAVAGNRESNMKAFRGSSPLGSSIYDLMTSMDSVLDTDDAVVRSSVTDFGSGIVTKILAQQANKGYLVDYRNFNMTDKVRERFRKREERTFIQMKYDKMKDAGNLYRQGGMIDMVNGKINRLTSHAADDVLEARIRRSKTVVGIAAAVGGIFMGQALNTMVGGYAVPDLKNITGKGGEYYEHRGGIMGSDLEGLKAPRPVRVVSSDREGLASMMRNANIMRSPEAYQHTAASPAYAGNNYRGVKV